MQALNKQLLADDIARIQLLHSRLGHDFAKSLAYHTGNFMFLKKLDRKNVLIGDYLDVLNFFEIKGDYVVTNKYNVLNVQEIESIIDDCYRELEKYNV